MNAMHTLLDQRVRIIAPIETFVARKTVLLDIVAERTNSEKMLQICPLWFIFKMLIKALDKWPAFVLMIEALNVGKARWWPVTSEKAMHGIAGILNAEKEFSGQSYAQQLLDALRNFSSGLYASTNKLEKNLRKKNVPQLCTSV